MKTHHQSKQSQIIAALMALSLVFLGVPLIAPDSADASETTLTAQSLKTSKTQSTAKTTTAELGLTSGHTYVLYSKVGSNKTLSIKDSSTDDGANARIWSLNRSANQQWVVKIDSKGYATIKNLNSGLFLSVKGSGKKSGTNVVQRAESSAKYQKWIISKNKNGTYRIKSAVAPTCSLNVNKGKSDDGTNVNILTSGTSIAQQWKLFDVTKMRTDIAAKAKKNEGSVKAGKYIIFSQAGTYTALDIKGASSANCANARTWLYHGGKSQQFTISYDKNGYALIKTSSGKYLDVAEASPADGTNVLQFEGHDGLNQRWIITKNSDGSVRIQSALWSNVSLDVHGGSASNGTNVEVFTSHKNVNQKWKIMTLAEAEKATGVLLQGSTKRSFSKINVSGANAAGIDVSQWQGSIDWNKVRASGIKFAIIRCGYGNDDSFQDDTKFLANVKGARAAGIKIGVYLYSYATNTSMAKSEAEHTLRLLKAANLTPSMLPYGVYYDVEDASQANSNLTKISKTYCDTIKDAGYRVGVYANLSWWNTKLTNSAFNNWNRWVAQWNTRCNYSGKHKLWQCMSDGQVPGIVGNVDMDLAY